MDETVRSRQSAPVADLETLMVGYQRADPQATAALVTALNPSLYRFFAVRSGTREQSEDLVQETWLRLHKVRHTYRPGERVAPWVFAIARHVGLDAWRKTKVRMQREVPAESAAEPWVNPASDDRLTAQALLAALPDSQRDVLTMLKINGLSAEEVARATSSTAGAVKQKAHRALQKLRSLMELKSGL